MNNQFEYTQALDTLCFTAEQKERIAHQAASAARKIHHRPVRRMVLIAAAVVTVLAVGTAGATGVLKSAVDSFSGIFGGDVAQTEIINNIGRPIGASATDNGVTITADAIIGDQYNACIVYSVSRDDGRPLLPDGVPVTALQLGGFGGSSWVGGSASGSAYFLDEDTSDNAVQYVETVSSDTPLNKGIAKVDFQNLCYWDEASGDTVSVAEGRWQFRFDVNYEDSSVTLGDGETFQQDGMTFTVDEITVSPVAVRVAYTVDHEVQWSNAPSGREDPEDSLQMKRYLENVEILLTKTDGTVISLYSAGGSLKPRNGKTICVKSDVLDTLIPTDELKSISVGGIVYLIHK